MADNTMRQFLDLIDPRIVAEIRAADLAEIADLKRRNGALVLQLAKTIERHDDCPMCYIWRKFKEG